MKLHEIVKLLPAYSDEELERFVIALRHRREQAQTVKKQKIITAKKREVNAEKLRLQRILKNMPPEQLKMLLESLNNGEG